MAIRSIVSATNTQWYQSSNAVVPVGTILPWVGGYFTASDNTGFTSVLGNNAASINSYLNQMGYYLCDGSVVSANENSRIFNVAGRRLPNLTDYRFLSGTNASTGIPSNAKVEVGSPPAGQPSYEGSNARVIAAYHLPAHRHRIDTSYADVNIRLGITTPAHGHTVTDPGHTHTLYGDNRGVSSGSRFYAPPMNNDQSNKNSGSGHFTATTTNEDTGITITGGAGIPVPANGWTAYTDNAFWGYDAYNAYNYAFNNRPAYLLVHFIMKVF
jgi:hypothetical protein